MSSRTRIVLRIALLSAAVALCIFVFFYMRRTGQIFVAATPEATLPHSSALSEPGSHLPVYFTNNMHATGVSADVTLMERALLNRIDGARSSIEGAFYDFNRDSVRDALIAAHRRGVDVRVVTDDEARNFTDAYIPYYKALESAGIPVKDDQREQSIMHNKYFVIDGQVVWTGSTNMSDNGFTKNHNNALALTSSQLASIYQRDFGQMWAGHFSVTKQPSSVTSLVVQSIPLEIYFSPKDNPVKRLIAEVDGAKTSIEFAIFFFTDDGLRDAMLNAYRRGVKIRGLWDELGAASPFSDDEALCAAGIPIKIENTVGKMHNKFMVIDADGQAPRVITGSLNWTSSANNANDENTLILRDAALSAAI